MSNRRDFITACLSGAAWLMGARAERPKQQHARKFIVETTDKPIPPYTVLGIAAGSRPDVTVRSVCYRDVYGNWKMLAMNEWRSKPCES